MRSVTWVGKLQACNSYSERDTDTNQVMAEAGGATTVVVVEMGVVAVEISAAAAATWAVCFFTHTLQVSRTPLTFLSRRWDVKCSDRLYVLKRQLCYQSSPLSIKSTIDLSRVERDGSRTDALLETTYTYP